MSFGACSKPGTMPARTCCTRRWGIAGCLGIIRLADKYSHPLMEAAARSERHRAAWIRA
jgi:hypothetical protein